MAQARVMRAAVLCSLTMLVGHPLRAQDVDATATASIELPSEVARVLRDYERAWAAGDEQALADLFTEDGFVRRPAQWVRGRNAIVDAYRDNGGDLRLRAHAYAASDTVGYIVGSYGYGDDPPGQDRGRFLLALRRTGPSERWLIAADLDHGN